MTDAQEIHSLISDEEFSTSLSQYTDSQLEYINDMNNTNYSSGQINFDTLSLRDKWWTPQDAFISIPISVTSSNATAYTEATLVAFKQSVLNLIYGVQVSTSSGQTIVNDNAVPLINNLRLLVEKDRNWYQSEAPKLLFSKDTRTLSNTAVGPLTPTSVPGTNAGLAERIGLFKQVCNDPFAGATFTATLQIPLQYLHDFFARCDFPMINTRWQLTFNVAAYQNTTIAPLFSDQTAVAPAVAAVPQITISNTCRLYYKSLKFSPDLNAKLVAKLNSGLVKKIEFRVTDTYTGETNQGPGTSVSRLVSPATVHPLRVWLLSPITNTVNPAGAPTTCYGSVVTSNASFSSANILVNNSLYYNNGLNTPFEQFKVLGDQFPGAQNSSTDGSLISYSDFLNGYRYLCFDLTRLKDRIKNPNESVSLQVQATRDSRIAACDYYYIVERLQKVVVNMSSSENKFVVGL